MNTCVLKKASVGICGSGRLGDFPGDQSFVFLYSDS